MRVLFFTIPGVLLLAAACASGALSLDEKRSIVMELERRHGKKLSERQKSVLLNEEIRDENRLISRIEALFERNARSEEVSVARGLNLRVIGRAFANAEKYCGLVEEMIETLKDIREKRGNRGTLELRLDKLRAEADALEPDILRGLEHARKLIQSTPMNPMQLEAKRRRRSNLEMKFKLNRALYREEIPGLIKKNKPVRHDG
jgi:hypothetical protein